MLNLLILSFAAGAATPFDCDSALANFLIRPQPPAARAVVAENRARGQSWRTAVTLRPTTPVPAELFADPEFALNGAVTEPFAARILSAPAPHGPARVFSMFLAPAEIDRHLDGRMVAKTDSPATEALGYLHYVREGHELIVTAVASDAFANFDAAAQTRYRAWPRVLLLAFERFAEQVFKDEAFRIVVQFKTAPTRSIAALPRQLGYHATRYAGAEAFGYTGSMLAASPHHARRDFKDKLTFKLRDRLATAQTEMAKATPRFSTSGPGKVIDGVVAAVRFTPLPAHLVYASEDQHRTHERVFKALPPWTKQFVKHSLVSLARGREGDAQRGFLALNGVNLTIDLPAKLERPAIAARDGHPDLILINGTGVRAESDQIFTPTDDGAVTGGVTEARGVAELRQHLDLIALGERAHVAVAVARPLDIGWPDHLPRVTGDQRKLVPNDEYVAHELRDGAERLVQTRYVVRTTARASAVEGAARAADFKPALASLLREAYAAFDERLNLPGASAAANAADYLREVSALNGGAPERILRRWMERSLGTIGVIHGDGQLLHEDAHANNVSLAGEFLSLARTSAFEHFGGTANLQARDVLHWGAAYRQMRRLVYGDAEPPEAERDPRFRFVQNDVRNEDMYEGAVYRHALAAAAAVRE